MTQTGETANERKEMDPKIKRHYILVAARNTSEALMMAMQLWMHSPSKKIPLDHLQNYVDTINSASIKLRRICERIEFDIDHMEEAKNFEESVDGSVGDTEFSHNKLPSFHVWRRHTNALNWIRESGIPDSQQREIVASCLLAYKCGRRHEREMNL